MNTRVLILGTFLVSMVIGLGLRAVAQPSHDAGVIVDAGKPVAAPAAGPTPPWAQDDPAKVVTEDPLTWGKEIANAYQSKDYWYLVALISCLVIWGLRELLTLKWKWFGTNRGGIATAGIVTFLQVGALALLAHQAPSLGLLSAAIMGAVTAMGGRTGIKRLIWPKDKDVTSGEVAS